MFVSFFYQLKESGIPVSSTAFLTLHRAFLTNTISNLNNFYIASRCILIKNEKYFDIFDQIFIHFFDGIQLSSYQELKIDEIKKLMLDKWLKKDKAKDLLKTFVKKSSIYKKMSSDEIIEYFKKRIKEQTKEHHGGSKWIGTKGTSPVGHSGSYPEGMRIGGISKNQSGIKVALERRYKDYNAKGPLSQTTLTEALKKLKKLVPIGPKDQINITKSIASTIKNGGEIDIQFDSKLKNQLKIILFIDNGGWSMDPYVSVVQTLFNYSKFQFKDIKIFYFHNTIYENVWEDPERYHKVVNINEIIKNYRDARLIIVGDASMAPFELMTKNGSIYLEGETNKISSIKCLDMLSKKIPYSVWLNPIPTHNWKYTKTIKTISQLFPMFELSIDGIEKAVTHLLFSDI